MRSAALARAAMVAVTALALTALPTLPASAAGYTANGVRCTKVGTAGNDVLTGTSSRDVICGRGGNDTIRSRGGNDLVDGGTGRDRLEGGSGNDTLLGGSGRDTMVGSTGRDYLRGGTYGDRLYGGDGADRLNGGDSTDVVSGGDAADVANGGPGGDTVSGGGGEDDLYGGDGNDDLDGGSGADDLDGNDGTNWCTLSAADVERRCVYDEKAPTSYEMDLTPSTVDVTTTSRTVRIRVHVRDDTGVRSVQLGAQDPYGEAAVGLGLADLVSGTVRDGWWEGTGTARVWSPPGILDVDVSMIDRVGRQGHRSYPEELRVVDRDPDLEMPTVVTSSARPSTGAWPLDVRSTTRTVTVRAHLTDDRSGLGTTHACLSHPSWTNDTLSYIRTLGCEGLELTSGTRTDGWWEATLPVPRGSLSGDWNYSIHTEDRAHGATEYWEGPDAYAYHCGDGSCTDGVFHPLPGGRGRFAVLGISDPDRATLEEVRIGPDPVDTLPGPVTVTVSAHLTETDRDGVRTLGMAVNAVDQTAAAPPDFAPVYAYAPSSGTRTDGWWRLKVTLPQGTPVGEYALQLWVEEAGHWTSYVSPSSPHAGSPDQIVITEAQLGGKDGTITVAPH